MKVIIDFMEEITRFNPIRRSRQLVNYTEHVDPCPEILLLKQ